VAAVTVRATHRAPVGWASSHATGVLCASCGSGASAHSLSLAHVSLYIALVSALSGQGLLDALHCFE
jgi:hypothetical protein